MRIREAVTQDPPRLVRALYQAVDAPGPTWRNLECYEIKYGKTGLPMLYAWCDKDPHNQIELFHVEKFGDIQVMQLPFSPRWPIKIR